MTWSCIAVKKPLFRRTNPRLLLLLLFVVFMQGIYNYMPETKYISKVYNVLAIL